MSAGESRLLKLWSFLVLFTGKQFISVATAWRSDDAAILTCQKHDTVSRSASLVRAPHSVFLHICLFFFSFFCFSSFVWFYVGSYFRVQFEGSSAHRRQHSFHTFRAFE